MGRPVHARGRRVALVLLMVVALGVGALLGLLGGHGVRRAEVPVSPLALPTGAPTPAEVATATAAPTPLPTTTGGAAPTPDAVRAALAGPLSDPRLGGRTLGRVVDVASGASLFGTGVDTPVAPASTTKITTAAAALTAYDAEDRVTTTVVAGPTPGAVTLVGAGDPTLSAAPVGTPTPYADAARVADLAASVAAHLGGAPVTAVYVDGSAFTGPATAPGWAPEDAPSEYGAPITAAMVDGGRDSPTADGRSGTPDLAAGTALAAALGVPGVPVQRTDAPPAAGATVLGQVASAPIGEIVDQMLQESDNVLADVLARLVAIKQGRPASFAGAAEAVRALLPGVGDGLVDGSGLSADDRLTATALTGVLDRVATTARLRGIVSMLPVAGWNGTLRDRFLTGPEATGAGRVRAKTGTLTAVSTLAGVVVTGSGRVLAFAVLADQVAPTYDGTLSAESALDAVAAALAGLP